MPAEPGTLAKRRVSVPPGVVVLGVETPGGRKLIASMCAVVH